MSSFQEINTLTQNCAATFEFSSEDAQRILFPTVQLEGVESSEDLKIRLERLYLKEARLTMHGSTLSEYWRNKKIPRGLRIQKAPTIGKHDENFIKRLGEILNKCSLDLMLLIINQVSTEASTVKAEIEKKEEDLREKVGTNFSSIESSIKTTVCQYKEKLLSIKLKKYKRDTEDYQRNEIYNWEFKEASPQPPTSSQGPTAVPRARTGPTTRSAHQKTPSHRRDQAGHHDSSLESDFTLDSDSGIPPSNPPFLYNRKKMDRRAQRNAGGASAHPDTARRPWTRNNSRTR